MRHADLSSSDEESQPSENEEQSGTSTDEDGGGEVGRQIRVDEVSPRKKRKRKSVAVSPSPSSELDRGRQEIPQCATASSKRKRRRWEWTIDSSISGLARSGELSEEVRKDQSLPLEEPRRSLDADAVQDVKRSEENGEIRQVQDCLSG
ncbi:hypothetical protein AYO21_04928 [Fonsecaea monophora]|uniref:Uncharacterized protein n=1 Tax=Fonsecaea monophora TaxID=254056 RepID=A0A177FB30_9EURO|nr:hypothetical protein AYO21_04928 [Fonsecaea monophora]KAH0841329.1 hypothetical protein FOPE_06566 [Fonsecaea pedrosoi]OAG40851.1 hypothetical protein AYO21_04928 [Fonsecaea monophora]